MALVVTWNVTFPSVLVVVKTLVPAEADTATRGEVPEVTGALEDPLPVVARSEEESVGAGGRVRPDPVGVETPDVTPPRVY